MNLHWLSATRRAAAVAPAQREHAPGAQAGHRYRPSSWLSRRPLVAVAAGYLGSGLGVAAVTWLISLVLPRWHIANISMTYLLLILVLAVTVGSGPAIVASIASFLAFDWFFVQPVGRFTVDDPSEWLALFLFLVVAIISSQLAAGLRRSAAEARRRARETAALYELSMAILGDARPERVLRTIAERMAATLALHNVAIFLLSDGQLQLAAEAGTGLSEAELHEREVSVRWAIQTKHSTYRYARSGSGRLMRPVEPRGVRPIGGETLLAAYVPMVLGQEVLGMVVAAPYPGDPAPAEQRDDLLQAFVAQAALAIGRARLAEEEEKARSAADSERMKSTFLASVSHDLRTPLTAIKVAAEGLRQDAELRTDVAHRDLAASIDHEVARLDRLVGNLLEISRIESGGLPLRRSLEDLSELMGSVAGRLASQLAGHRLSVAIPDDLPLLPLDAVQIERVLTNLLENAIKFSSPESEIRVRAGVDGEFVWLRMHNAGPPLPEQERERIFDKFYRLNSSRPGPSGVGLGLAICRGIVEAHGGRIWSENEAGGVTFAFELPLATGATPSSPAGASA